jgi:simple sugar transport system permease protein
VKEFFRTHRDLLGLTGVLCAAFLIMWGCNPSHFVTLNNLRSMAFQLPEIGILTLGMMVAMLHGGINLSIVGLANLTGITVALVLHAMLPPGVSGETGWWSVIVAVATGFFVSLLVGFLQGVLIGYAGVSAILATLGTMTLVNGACVLITHGSTLSSFPNSILFLGNGSLGPVPLPLLLFLICAALLSIILRRTTFGFSLYMLGTNQEATKFAGINNRVILLRVYLLSSVLASIAGLVMMGRFNSVKADYGQSYLLITVLAAVLGGTSAGGGYGKVLGVVLAVVMLQIIASGLNLLGVDPFFAIATWGAILLVVMTLNHFLRARA